LSSTTQRWFSKGFRLEVSGILTLETLLGTKLSRVNNAAILNNLSKTTLDSFPMCIDSDMP
jgi:hypothetical protein